MASTAYESLLDRLEVQYTNVAARRIAGVARTARLEILHMVAGVMTVRNMYLQQCGLVAGRALRGHHGVAHTDMQSWVNTKYGVDNWNIVEEELDPGDALMKRRAPGKEGPLEIPKKGSWRAPWLPEDDGAVSGLWVTMRSTYRAKADIIQDHPEFRKKKQQFG